MLHPVLTTIAQLGSQTFAPQAAELDRNPAALRQALQLLGQHQLLALKVPTRLGGLGLDPLTYYQYQESLSRDSGALAFLQTQHQSAIALLAQSQNTELDSHLRAILAGQSSIGIAFSHLRRPTPTVKAIPVAGGYQISGHIPWITGWELFDQFILAAVLPDDRALYGLLPLQNLKQPTGGTLQLSAPMDLVAMTGTQTVSSTLQDWILPQSAVVTIRPGTAIHHSDRTHVLAHSAFCLGCAQAGLDWLQQLCAQTPPTSRLQSPLRQTLDRHSQQLQDCRAKIYAALPTALATVDAANQPEEDAYRRSLRVRALHLALKITQTAVIASSGTANLQQHPAGRLYREAMAFSITGQTLDLRIDSLMK